MSKHVIRHYTNFRKQPKVDGYNEYLLKAIEKGQLDTSFLAYKDATNKKNSKSLFGPISF